MKLIFKYFAIGLLVIVVIILIVNFKSTINYLNLASNTTESSDIRFQNQATIHAKAKSLLVFAKANKMDTTISFLIDMNRPSGSYRFYVYDFTNKKIIDAALVTHGSCYESIAKGKRYSNKVGGGCTSLGKYKIGHSYMGKFGLAYKLYGLDNSNSNAFERFVVLHSHSCVPNAEVAPYPICLSEGCPTVSPTFLKKLSTIIDNKTQPILMEIYDDAI